MIVIVAGASASGKSTVGGLLAQRLGWAFEDGDALHPAANIAKMRSGIPLTDADRWPWLDAVGAWMDGRIRAGKSAVVACSALKRCYRDRLCRGRPQASMVFLRADRDLLRARLAARHGHFFAASLLDSQFSDLEPPGAGERVLVVSAEGRPDDIAADIIARLGLPTDRRNG